MYQVVSLYSPTKFEPSFNTEGPRSTTKYQFSPYVFCIQLNYLIHRLKPETVHECPLSFELKSLKCLLMLAFLGL